jgi:DNA-binding MarR family transcriptional regulator
MAPVGAIKQTQLLSQCGGDLAAYVDVHRVNMVRGSAGGGQSMPKSDRGMPTDEASVMLSLLQAVERQNNITQRSLAEELGVAVGLINAYVKRGVKRGLIKVQQVPKRRFAYYLTPQGFAEKSRLAALYIASSLEFFRQARQDCEAVAEAARQRGWRRVVLVGASELAEVAIICAFDSRLKISGVVDACATRDTFHGIPVLKDMRAARAADGAIVTALDARDAFVSATDVFGVDRVLVPKLLLSALAPSPELLREAAQ